ncbi:MAG: hypothetical protein J6Y53_03150 [Alphaproteobacteria bacterium]|nr:hypothetical protein [Alphaproteobacteria bacterium]
MSNFWKNSKIRAKIFFRKPLSDDDLLFLFKQLNFKLLNEVSLSPEKEVMLINFNSFDLFKWYVQYLPLREPAQMAILDKEDLFEHYIGLQDLEPVVEAEFIRRNNTDLIRRYIDMHRLYDESEKIMLDVCSRNVIVPYIRMHDFGPLSLVKLIKSGDEFLIKTYIDWHTIRWRTAQLALIENGNEKLIKYYICQNDLSDEAETELIKMQNEELIKLYIKGHRLSRAAKVALLETGNVKLFELYTANHI